MSEATPVTRVTYATLTPDNEPLNEAYEAGIEVARGWLGAEIWAPTELGGRPAAGSEPTDVLSPADPAVVVARVHESSPEAVQAAIAAAKAAAPGWAATPWQDRVALMRRVADLISDQAAPLAALMTMEVAKNRLEALGDVEEAAVFFRYYADQMEHHDGFVQPMDRLSDAEETRSVMRPHGVWGVISPFNFPMALAAGPAAAALVAGNTVVIKPSVQGSHVAWKLYEALLAAGLPDGVVQLVPGGDEAGRAVVASDDVDGLTFTGSYDAGMAIIAARQQGYPRPVIAEMGGKNAAIVSAEADLDTAAQGVARSAFGFSGQKCSACSRVYVERSVYPEFLERLTEKAGAVVIGDPLDRDTFVGPVVDADAVARFADAVEHARSAGRIAAGGEVLAGTEGYPGSYVTPTVAADLPLDDRLFREELFVPFVAVSPVEDLATAMREANGTVFGLTAGFFSTDDAEVDWFLREIEAGVVYVNRPAGATTGAWPGVQPFGGWKGSGSSGKAGGGLYYVAQFMREQSQSVVG